ncbi:2738_t:CDS:2, partial [Cetraspora pellucida]
QQTKEKIGSNLIVSLETLLDTQVEIAKSNNTFAIRQLQREAKEKLQSKLSLEEINKLCQLQSEITQLEIQENQSESSENCAHSVDAHPNADKITLIYRGIGHSGDGICERCLYLITSAHERNAENRRIAEEQERIKKEKQNLYKQTCQKFKELESQLKKQGTDICRYCLNKINGGD